VIHLAKAGYASFVADGTFTAIGSGTILIDSGELDTGSQGATFDVANTVTFAWSNATVSVPVGATINFNGPLARIIRTHSSNRHLI
jgi:hypothetical protein